MPKTRYIEEYDNQGRLVNSVPYEVSDEEVASEQEKATCEVYLAQSPDVITQPEIWYLLRAFAKQLGYKVG